MKKYIYSMAVAAVLTGCKVGKNYQQPEVNLPAQFTANAVQGEVVENSLNKLSYDAFFNNDELAQLIDQAVANNADVQVAISNLRQTELLYKQSRLAVLPELSLQAGASRMESSKNSQLAASGASRTNDDFNAHLGLHWELDVWGKIRREKEASLATYLQQEEVMKAVRNRVIAEVATAYVNLLMLDEQFTVAKESEALRANTYRLTKKLFDVGNGNVLAIQQAEAQWLEAQELLPQLEQEISLQESALNVLLNDYPKVLARKNTIGALDFQTDVAQGVPADFLRNRPDIQVAEFGLRHANAKVGVAQGQMYPSLSITAQGGLNSFEASDWFKTPASLFGMIGGNLLQPIFNQKKLRTQYEVAKEEREKAAVLFKQAVVVGFSEVHNALVKIEKVKQKADFTQQRVAVLNTSLVNTKRMFEMDKASYLEVIHAQDAALGANLNYAGVKRDYLSAMIELYRALGGY